MRDRVWDAAAMLLILSGITLFFFARHALESLGAGTYAVPKGVSYVERADFHSEQSTVGLYVAASGVVIGIASAVRHARRPR